MSYIKLQKMQTDREWQKDQWWTGGGGGGDYKGNSF